MATNSKQPRDADWVSGAGFLVRRSAFAAVGGFDEAYFMYVEDVDLCWRLHRAGWGVLYVPSARAVHEQGRSTSRRPYRMMAAHHRSILRFAVRSSEGRERLLIAPGGRGARRPFCSRQPSLLSDSVFRQTFRGQLKRSSGAKSTCRGPKWRLEDKAAPAGARVVARAQEFDQPKGRACGGHRR